MIIVFKTHSGQEVICTYNDDSEFCEKARIIHPIQQNDGKLSLALIPYFITNPDAAFELLPGTYTHYIDSVPKEIEDYYLQQTSGIVLGSAL